MFAKIILNNKSKMLNRTFDYKVPSEFYGKIKVGSRVLVPFANRKEDGYVLEIAESSEHECKEIIELLTTEEIAEYKIDLAKIMSKRYFCNLSDCIKLMLNPEMNTKNIEDIMQNKKVKVIALKKEEYIESLEKGAKYTEKQKKVIDFLSEKEENRSSLKEILEIVSTSVISGLEKKNILKKIEIEEEVQEEIVDIPKVNFLTLNNQQEKIYKIIEEDILQKKNNIHLIHGVTGSGKTEIYLQLIKKVIDQGKGAIVLVPEISLTPQMLSRFTERFGKEVAILHSRLGARKRFEEWNRIKEGKAKIVIGARSGIFAPIKELGIIIIDEEHDSSYKSDQSPKYDAKEVARYIAKRKNIPLVLGTATPLVSTYYEAQEGKIILHKLEKRATNIEMPEVVMVDMTKETNIISETLKQEILDRIEKQEQIILFLNRRGYSSANICKECKEIVKCKRCNISLTYHKQVGEFKCHYCGYRKPVYEKCVKCNGQIEMVGVGTQKLEEKLKEEIPSIRILRMDLDTTTRKDAHQKILKEFDEGNADILIGTQMVIKGHHFKNVTLAVVVLADSMLNFESYRAGETAYQNIVQLIGRAGREKKGKAIIQTYNTKDGIINFAKDADYQGMYETEIMVRDILKYPPFNDMIQINILSYKEEKAEKIAQKVKLTLEKMKEELLEKLEKELKENKNEKELKIIQTKILDLKGMKIYPEQPLAIDKVMNQYRWKVIIKCKLSTYLAGIFNYVVKKYTKFKDPIVSVELNSLNI